MPRSRRGGQGKCNQNAQSSPGAANRGSGRRINWNGQRRSDRIPYEIDRALTHLHGRIIRAMETIQEHSRFRFVKRRGDSDYLKITKANGCYFSSDGIRQGYISIGVGCESFGTILHELLHSLGFPHEQRRPDRDEYIDIMWRNIEAGAKNQFYKLRPNEYIWYEFGFPFDYDSVMMYDEYAFSKNGLETIVAHDGRSLQRNTTLSDLDKEKLRVL